MGQSAYLTSVPQYILFSSRMQILARDEVLLIVVHIHVYLLLTSWCFMLNNPLLPDDALRQHPVNSG